MSSSDLGGDPMFLRVHSKDLHEHIAQEVGECLDNGLYTDLIIRCKEGKTLKAHRLVLCAISPYFKLLLSHHDVGSDVHSIELPDAEHLLVQRLLEVVYNGSVEATMDEISELILFAHSLYIKIPVSTEIIELLDLTLPELRALPSIRHLENDSKQRKKNGDTPREYICPHCNASFNNFGNFGQHMRQMHATGESDRMARINHMITSSYDPNLAQYTCDICKSSYSHPGNFKQHLLKHEREANGKPKSNSLHKSLPGSNSHLNSVLHSAFADRVDHGDRNLDANIKMYECETCGRVFKHPGNFKQHMSSHFRASSVSGDALAPKRIKLPQLPTVPVPQSSIPTSSLASSPPKAVLQPTGGAVIPPGDLQGPSPCPVATRWKCNHCFSPTYFQSREKLRIHVASNHRGPNALHPSPKRPLPSNLVPSMPLAPSSLISPQSAAAYKECEICHQLFDNESQLSQHMTTHVTIKEEDQPNAPSGGPPNSELTFQCDEPGCTQAFSKEIWVRKHKETFHEISSDKLGPNEGIYECRICKKVFSKSNKLSAHMRVHRAPQNHYRYPCDICGKRFTRPQHVNRHKLLHTGERLHKCKDCNAAFAREDKLRYHMANECEYSVINMENIDYELDEGELLEDEETITS
eukprot:TRINITY_DN950_c0_g1_i2.p1 TRINITY_DN950_c0_g1~~TRINITY_DN950_c0_g1_i2.p1  ORF type:complete len:638 (-),score=199.34 TRINITY_DN950_c0_g1_i2:247-2160(-)